MILDEIIRGNVVEFTAIFLDANGNAVDPSSAQLKVNFLNASEARETISMTMTPTTGGWFAEWDSGVALEARVYWSVQSATPSSAKDGAFLLRANLANVGTV